MPGINLSQSAKVAEEKLKPRASFADKSIYIAFILLVLAGGSYGGVYFYLQSLEKTKTSLVLQIDEEKRVSYGGEDIQGAARFFVKTKEVVAKRSIPDINPKSELAVLSAEVIPEVKLGTYENSFEKNTVHITGKAQEFRNVAEQMHIFKQSKNFLNVSTGNLSLGKDGTVDFVFDMERVASNAEAKR